MMCSDMFIY